MIIRPSRILIGLDRHDPEEGFYRARLRDITRREGSTGRPSILFNWELLSHPDQLNDYFAFSVYPLLKPGFLSKTFLSWEGVRWKDLEAREADGVARPERYIGKTADIQILPQGRRTNFGNVGLVRPAGSLVEQLEDGSYQLTPRAQILTDELREMGDGL